MTLPWLALFRRRIELPIRRALLVHYLLAFRQRRLIGHAVSPHVKSEGQWPVTRKEQ